MKIDITIPIAVKQLCHIVNQLHNAYPKKKFTLDGRLVGDLGEILVEAEYELELHEGLHKYHDAKTPDGRQVQIKTTMKNVLTFPADHVPDYYLGIKVDPNGTLEEVFNGPGSVAAKSIKKRKPTKNNLHSISINTLAMLNDEVREEDRIHKRADDSLTSQPSV